MPLAPSTAPIRKSVVALVAAVLVYWGAGCQNRVASQQPRENSSNSPQQSSQAPSGDRAGAGDQLAQANPRAKADGRGNPFPRRFETPDFPQGATWINSKPLRKRDLQGKFVLLDFWTYCCINCMHILPELKKAEKAYPNNLVVIGVHSAKFQTEKEAENIRDAVLRYEIQHPVLNDPDHQIWETYGVKSWPTLLLLDPEGKAVWGKQGETRFEDIDEVLSKAIPYYRAKGLLDETPLRFELEQFTAKETPLRFPGKVLADEKGGRLFIADSNHNRLVVSSLDGKLIETIGSGELGASDGDFASAQFDHPQGMALDGDTLYVADTENHLLRKVDLRKKHVTTIAGTGRQATFDELPRRRGARPLSIAINSPWALCVHEKFLYIAMAGPHQIWRMTLDGRDIGPYAGNGVEDIVDGPLLPRQPFTKGFASFAQPSGLTSDGKWLYVADSEGSSIRAVPFDPKADVRTVVGTQAAQFNRLFKFGFVDGRPGRALLQHPLGVVYHEGKIYVADTYNNAIRVVDAKSGVVSTLAGVRDVRKVSTVSPLTGVRREVEQTYGRPGFSDEEGTFDEPAGITLAGGKLYVADTNNHAIRTVELAGGKVGTLTIDGLTPPASPAKKTKPSFPGAVKIPLAAQKVKTNDGKLHLDVQLELPLGWKINELAPMGYYIESKQDAGVVLAEGTGKFVKLSPPSKAFEVALPVSGPGRDTLEVSMNYYYCQEGGDGLCKVGAVVWTVPLTISSDAGAPSVKLSHRVQD